MFFIAAPHGMYKNGIRDVFKEMMAKEGIFALYKGVTPVMLRAFPANGVSTIFLSFTDDNSEILILTSNEKLSCIKKYWHFQVSKNCASEHAFIESVI